MRYRTRRTEVNGWVNLDKPVGITSTQAVGRLKFLFNAEKVGHAGTLDPLASGVLPIAFGEATKTIAFVQETLKCYRFSVKWGVETDTDDSEGRPVASFSARPEAGAVIAALPRFLGKILQTPPLFSAIKIAGERAYDLAREGTAFEIAPREVFVQRLEMVAHTSEETVFEAECGKGTYVRSLARDLGRVLECGGHVSTLRRTRVGPFLDKEGVTLERLEAEPDGLRGALLNVEAGLSILPRIEIDRNAAAALRLGQRLLLRGGAARAEGPAYASCFGSPVAVGAIEGGEFVSSRVFNLR